MFGASEKLSRPSGRNEEQSVRMQNRGTFVGTRDFLSPEMVGDYSLSGPFTDLWSLGIICFQLYTGRSPWQSSSNDGVLEEIANVADSIQFPSGIPADAKSLITILLRTNPAERMGLTSQSIEGDWYAYEHLFGHDYFKGIDVGQLEADSEF